VGIDSHLLVLPGHPPVIQTLKRRRRKRRRRKRKKRCRQW
jgi:hypothetical protein